MENNVDKDGTITLIQTLKKVVGLNNRNGYFIYIIMELEINGLKLLNILKGGQTML